MPTVLPDNLNPSNEVSTINTNKEYLEETLGGGVSQWVPLQRNETDRLKSENHGGGKLPLAAGRPWYNAARCARVDTATSGNYLKTPFLRGGRRGHQVDWWKT